MPITKHYTSQFILEDLKFSSLKINIDDNLIIGKSLFDKRSKTYIENTNHTIFDYMKQSNKNISFDV